MAHHHSPKIVTDGLVFAIDPINLKSLPNPRHLNSFDFDGSDDFINIDSVLTGGTNIASDTKGVISLWVRPVDGTPATQEEPICFGDTNAVERLLFANLTTGELYVNCAKAGATQWDVQTTAAAFSDNKWTHICLVHDGTTAGPVLYVDGAAPAQSIGITTDKTVWFNALTGLDNGRIGCRNQGGAGNTNHYNGNITEVAIFNTNLTAAAVTELYNSGNPFDVRTHTSASNLVSYYPLGDGDTWNGSNWIVNDVKNNNNGTSSNMALADLTGSLWAQTNLTSMVPNNITGSMKGGVHYTSSALGALHFDGTDDYIQFPSTINITSTQITADVWFRFDDVVLSNDRIFELQDGTNSIQLIRDDANDAISTRHTQFETLTGNAKWFAPVTGVWYNIVVVWDSVGNTTTFYRNAESLTPINNSVSIGEGNQPNKIYIGNRSDLVSSGWFHGNVAQVKIYNRALSASEIQQNYNAIKGRYQ